MKYRPREYAMQLVEDGLVDAKTLLRACVNWMGGDEVRAMLEAEQLAPDEDEDTCRICEGELDSPRATLTENRLINKVGLYFDYLSGRVMKVDISGDTLDPRLYDRDNGEGAAARALGL